MYQKRLIKSQKSRQKQPQDFGEYIIMRNKYIYYYLYVVYSSWKFLRKSDEIYYEILLKKVKPGMSCWENVHTAEYQVSKELIMLQIQQ